MKCILIYKCRMCGKDFYSDSEDIELGLMHRLPQVETHSHWNTHNRVEEIAIGDLVGFKPLTESPI